MAEPRRHHEAANGAPRPTSATSTTAKITHFEPHRYPTGVSLLADVSERGHSSLSFPIFFWLTAQVIPLRSGLHVFCFPGSSPNCMGPSHKADASLRLKPPRSLSCSKENGAESETKTTSYLVVKWNSFWQDVSPSMTVRLAKTGLYALLAPLPQRRPVTP